MEFLESQDPEKKKLIEASERHKRALEKGVSDLSNNTQKVLTNALIIGGVMALSYIVVRQLSSSGRSKKRKKKAKVTVVQPSVSTADDEDYEETDSPGLLADLGTIIANQATVVIIDFARQKLLELLESRKKEE
jgi:hypothetical protein